MIEPVLVLPFHLRGHDGEVAVFYADSRNPVEVGFDIPGLTATAFDLSLAAGYPVCEARIAYGGTGYRAFMGWIQLVTHVDPVTGRWENPDVDLFPILADTDSPFMVFGHAPTMFDAPANPGSGDMDWIADTFLVACPDVARTRRVAALLGFRWGYALRDDDPKMRPLESIDPEAWERVLPALSQRFPDWQFIPGFASLSC